MQNSKIPGIYYFEYVADKDTAKKTIPSIPPYTTWSGYLECPADSPYAKRLLQKCGGVSYKVKAQDWVKGFWTAPVDWPEMAAGRESDTPFSPTTYKVTDFPFASLKA